MWHRPCSGLGAMWQHWAIRTNSLHSPFAEADVARFAWNCLGRSFPDTLMAVLMPNHLHIILPSIEELAHRDALHGWMGAVSRHAGVKKLWQYTPSPRPISNRKHLLRHLRYVALNPCRDRLCRDPLEWIWSTYRDLFEASAYPILSPQTLASVLQESRRTDFLVRFHAYVSSDPSVAITGSAPPARAASPTHWPDRSLSELHTASSAALRLRPSDITDSRELQKLFVRLALHQGWRGHTGVLAQLCSVSPRTIQRHAMTPIHAGHLHAATVCAGEPRFRQFEAVARYDNYAPPPPGGGHFLSHSTTRLA